MFLGKKGATNGCIVKEDPQISPMMYVLNPHIIWPPQAGAPYDFAYKWPKFGRRWVPKVRILISTYWTKGTFDGRCRGSRLKWCCRGVCEGRRAIALLIRGRRRGGVRALHGSVVFPRGKSIPCERLRVGARGQSLRRPAAASSPCAGAARHGSHHSAPSSVDRSVVGSGGSAKRMAELRCQWR
jgi:hypothetical protein